MIAKKILSLGWALVIAAILLASGHAQNASAIHSLTQPAIGASSSATMTNSAPSPTMETLIRSRARALGDRTSADGVRYWVQDGSTLKGKSPNQVLQSLSPPPIASPSHVRAIDIVVDLHQPLTIFASPGQQVSIGTATVNGASVHDIAVTSIISMEGLNIVRK